jgi:acyl carrier protein
MGTKEILRIYIRDNHAFGADALPDDRASLLERGVIDSTGVLDLVAFLEREFAIEIRDDELVPDNLDSIEAIATFVARKQEEEAAQAAGGEAA